MMDEPERPPAQQPPPGWYADPVTGTGLRYWDGRHWTDHHQPDPQMPGSSSPAPRQPGRLRPVGALLEGTFKTVLGRLGHLFPLMVVLSVPTGLVLAVATYRFFDGLVLVIDDTTAEIELLGFDEDDPPWGQLGFLVGALLLNLLAGLVLSVSFARQSMAFVLDQPEPWTESLKGGLRRMPRAVGYLLVSGLVLLVPATIALAAIVVFPLSALLLLPVLIVGGVWWMVRASLFSTAAAVGPSGRSLLRPTFELTRGQVLALLGRFLLVFGLIMGIQFATSAVTGAITSAGGSQVDPDATRVEFTDLLGGNPALFGLSQLFGLLINTFASALVTAANVLFYRDLDGSIDPELSG